MKLIITLFLIGLFGVPVRAAFLADPLVDELSNGLKVVWFLDDRSPTLDVSLILPAGYRHDLPGKSGTAELVGSLLERGASGLPGEQSQMVDGDTLQIKVHGLSRDGVPLLDDLAKVALNPDFPPDEIVRERSQMLHQLSHLDEDKDLTGNFLYAWFFYARTPYGRGRSTSAKELNHIRREDLLRFHQDNFVPSQSLLVISGQANRSLLFEKIRGSFGVWPERTTLSGQGDKKTSQKASREKVYFKKELRDSPHSMILVDVPKVSVADVRIGLQFPKIQKADYYSVVVANALLGDFFNSRLNRRIRDKLGLSYAIGSGITLNQEVEVFSIAALTRNETSARLIQEIMEVLNDLKRIPVTEDEVETTKKFLKNQFPMTVLTVDAVASRWIAGYLFNMGPQFLSGFSTEVTRVNVEKVRAVVDRYFDLDRVQTLVVGDAALIKKGLESVQLPKPKTIKISHL